MKKTWRWTTPEETAKTLIESPGVIRQRELKELCRLREIDHPSDEENAASSALGDSLRERFEQGWLVEMGSARAYLDHVGVFVIEETIMPWLLN